MSQPVYYYYYYYYYYIKFVKLQRVLAAISHFVCRTFQVVSTNPTAFRRVIKLLRIVNKRVLTHGVC